MTENKCEECKGNPIEYECIQCSEKDCDYKEPFHYHHDGCPACYQNECKCCN